MEILRFDDERKTTPNRKKSSRSLLILGLVGALFGISSAFASSTIDINGNNRVNLGQGVVKVSGCDIDVSVVPSTKMIVEVSGPTFYLDKILISNVDTRTATEATNFDGCGGKTFDLQIFDPAKTPYDCSALNPSDDFNVTYELSSSTVTISGANCDTKTLSFTMPAESTFSTYTNPEFSLHFNKAPSDISYITLVSKS